MLKSPCRLIALLLLVAAASQVLTAAALAQEVDRMDHADHFWHTTPVTALESGNGKVALSKTGSGDAFVRWSLRAPAAMGLSKDTDRVEVDFAGFKDGGSVQVLLMIDDATSEPGRPEMIEVENSYRQPGRLVIESVSELAKDHGMAEPVSYQLFFRIANDPTGTVVFDQIRVAPKGSQGPAVEKRDAEPQGAASVPSAEPGTDVAEVVFEKAAVERGMGFDRTGVEPAAGSDGGWVVDHHPGGAEPWQRTFNFDITDPILIDGKRPSLDIEVTYMLNAWGAVHVVVDTDGEPREVAMLWGNSEDRWKTATVRLDDAELANGIGGKYDLRLSGDNGPLLLKRVRVVGYDPKEDVRWDRLLKVDSVDVVHSAAEPVFLFNQQDEAGFAYQVQNHAQVAAPLRYEAQVVDFQGEVVHQESGPFVAEAERKTPVTLRFDTSDWPYGPYTSQVKLYLDSAAGQQPAFSFNTMFGVISDTELARARPGEYLYGLDAGDGVMTPEALSFYDAMGIDILRYFHTSGLDIDSMERDYQTLEARGMTSAMIIDPPGQIHAVDEATRLKQLEVKCEQLEKAARHFRGRITYWELGNEPDLPFFYPGPIDEYLDSYYRMYDAVKRGNPDAVVMNGGLCFFGEEGDRRARELIRKMDMSKIDMWAYHAHGPGAGSERHLFERMKQAAAAVGKDTIPYLDTETGVAASSPSQYPMQARTGVQKPVYAQAQGMFSLMFFRLYMDVEAFWMAENRYEPRPVILSTRSMVERLRHHRFAREIETESSGIEAYLFEQVNDEAQPTGRKTLVAWNTGSGSDVMTLQIDPQGQGVAEAMIHDMYGNSQPVEVSGGSVTLPVAPDVVYLSWDSAGEAAGVAAAPPPLEAQDVPAFRPSGENLTAWTVRNPTDAPMDVTPEVRAFGDVPTTVKEPAVTETLAPGETRTLQVTVETQGEAELAVPNWWQAFVNVDAAQIERMSPDDFGKVPQTLPGSDGKPVQPVSLWVPDQNVKLVPLTGPIRERRPALLFATLDSPREMDLDIAAAADWWMRWYVNGTLVHDNFDEGDSGPTPISLPLEEGRNVIAVHVLSGSEGFALHYRSQREQAAAAGGRPPDRLEATLRANGRSVVQQVVPVSYLPRLREVVDLDLDAPLSEWLAYEPIAVLDEAAVHNFHEAHPDNSRWYGGPQDLSAIAWMRQAGEATHLVVAVRDDHADNPAANPEAAARPLDQHDALRITATSANTGESSSSWTIAPTLGDPISDATGPLQAATATIDQLEDHPDGFRYVYRITFPSQLDLRTLASTIYDADQGIAKQTLSMPPMQIVTD